VVPVPPARKVPVASLAVAGFFALVVVATFAGYSSGKPTPAPSAPSPHRSGVPRVAPVAGRTLYFAPFDDFPADRVTMLVDYYRTKYGVEARVLRPALLDPNAWDAQRGQVVAESVLASVKAVHGDVASDPGAVIIALVTRDMYLRTRTDWAWAFGLRSDGRFAVVSTARMTWPGGSAGEAGVPSRLRKMVGKDVGLMYFGLPVSDDPHSVLYRDILGVDDLDRMGEDF
jgi:predicted Zn-dependent protease